MTEKEIPYLVRKLKIENRLHFIKKNRNQIKTGIMKSVLEGKMNCYAGKLAKNSL